MQLAHLFVGFWKGMIFLLATCARHATIRLFHFKTWSYVVAIDMYICTQILCQIGDTGFSRKIILGRM